MFTDDSLTQLQSDLKGLMIDRGSPSYTAITAHGGPPGASISVLLNSARLPTERMLRRFLYGLGLDAEEARPWLERRRALARDKLTTDGDTDGDAPEADSEDEPAAPGSPAIAEEAGAATPQASTMQTGEHSRGVKGSRPVKDGRIRVSRLIAVTLAIAVVGGGLSVAAGRQWGISAAPDRLARIEVEAGQNPNVVGCGTQVETAAAAQSGDVLLELRYSPRCRAVWGRINRGDGAIIKEGVSVEVTLTQMLPTGVEPLTSAIPKAEKAYTMLLPVTPGDRFCVTGAVTTGGKTAKVPVSACTTMTSAMVNSDPVDE